MLFEAGTVYHGLTLLHYCGGGAFGEVYFGQDISGRKVAVKIISKQRIGTHWERELRGVANYRSITENRPELLQIYHVEQDEETFYYTMEIADNIAKNLGEYQPDTLANRLINKSLTPDDYYGVLQEIFSGIAIIHQAGFAHRDIKPDNIIFINNHPKIGDIGLMSSLENSQTQWAGSLDFIPPEQRTISGASDSNSRQKNDLYAFGKVIYCVITNNNPPDFPSIPTGMALSLSAKLFLRLAFALCAGDNCKRLESLSGIQTELTAIERQIREGEKFKDKCRYFIKSAKLEVKSALWGGWRWSLRHWILVLLLLLTFGVITYALWPEPEFDITKVETKVYFNDEFKISMNIPVGWFVLSAKTLDDVLMKKFNHSIENFTEEEKKLYNYFKTDFSNKKEIIICAPDKSFSDNILFTSYPQGKVLIGASDEELKFYVYSMFSEMADFKLYELKRVSIVGFDGIFWDCSYVLNSQVLRIYNYMIFVNGQIICCGLTAHTSTFFERRKEFEAVLKTMKFAK